MASAPFLTPAALRLLWGLDPAAFLREFDVPPVLGHFVLPLYVDMPESVRLRLLDRIPLLVLPEVREGAARRAYAAADCAVREAVPLALDQAGLLREAAFGYLACLHPVVDRGSAGAAEMAAWDACVTLARHNGPPAALWAAAEARDAATDAHWGGGHGAWAEACATHAAQAVAHCAHRDPQAAWELGFKCLDRMLGPVA